MLSLKKPQALFQKVKTNGKNTNNSTSAVGEAFLHSIIKIMDYNLKSNLNISKHLHLRTLLDFSIFLVFIIETILNGKKYWQFFVIFAKTDKL